MGALSEARLPAVGFDDPMTVLAAIQAETRLRVLITRLNFGRGKLNGAALARMLRHNKQDVRTVFVGRPKNRVHVESEGEFLPMPIDAFILVETVARLLTGALAR